MKLRIVFSSLLCGALLLAGGCQSSDRAPADGSVAQQSEAANTPTYTPPDTSAATPPAAPAATATNTAAPASQDPIRRTTVAELDAAMKQGNVVLIDVRTAESYNAGHIPGSINIPAIDIGNRLSEIPRDKKIVTYCT